ncbi:putative vacuolar aminopeptidase 1 [Amylocarpus encephaloides]|uniref:Vacuolar aminopeptidase 1 n=1 Tax=Amylocarpus encephaloides TaxID=45428 RepID=A0A9P8C1B6_9HELO|nr:putative vacuolar aminopeptidase 1 [Amylocarpus encephaloides]
MKDSAWRPHNGSTFPPQTSREFQHELDLTRQTRNDASQRSAHNSASSTGVKAALWHISYDGNIKRGDPPRWTSIEHEAGVPTLLAPHPSLYQQYNGFKQELQLTPRPDECSTPRENVLKTPEAYTKPFCDFLTENPTVWHAVDYFEKKLEKAGFSKLSERKIWTSELQPGGKYFVTRNGSSMVAFTVGKNYKSGNGVAMIAGHVDALTARLKPVSTKKTTAGYVQLGVAPYGGGLNTTWWDRDLSIGGRVLVKDSKTGKITTRLVKLGWPIAKIPTLAPHFGVGMEGQQNKETQTVPIIGLDYSSDIYDHAPEEFVNLTLGGEGTFISTQPPKLVRAIAGELSIENSSSIVNWELELYDCQPAQLGGLDKEFIFAGRIDDKLCSWAAMEGLLASASSPAEDDSIVKLVAVFDDEEIGSLLRQGARGNFLSSTVERVSEAFSSNGSSANILSQTYANSFLVSADVTHAVHPNFLASYLEGHAPRLNVGLVVSADSNGHMTTDSVSTALLTRVAEKTNNKLQLFMIRNDSRGGGTVGPMLSSAMGVRGIDAGLPQLSMHSIRATTGSLDPGLGVSIFKGFLDNFESVDKEFE